MWTTKSIQARALLYTILISAICHLLITLFTALFTGMPDKANMFVVLGLNLIWPEIGKGAWNAILGGLTVVFVWVIIVTVMKMHIQTRKRNKAKHETAV